MRMILIAASALICCAACGDSGNDTGAGRATVAASDGARQVSYTEAREPCAEYTATRRALFGDLHVHSAFSFDAAANSLETYPDHAIRFAKGESIPFFPLDEDGNPAGEIAIDRPLDFVSITDHGEFLGERALCRTDGSPKYDADFCREYRSSERQGMLMLGTIVNMEAPVRLRALCGDDGALCREWSRGPWQEMIDAAERHYDRSAACAFTSFIGYEYTGTPGLSNIHRNVIFRNSIVPPQPISYIEAPVDRQLWEQLDAACPPDEGCDWVTIPHNSNLANGRMFEPLGGDHDHEHAEAAQREHAEARLANEPVIEIFQHKGNSECLNGLATIYGEPDQLCDVEAVRRLGQVRETIRIAVEDGHLVREQAVVSTGQCGDGTGADGMLGGGCVDETDFVRSNLLVGLEDDAALGVNSAKLGIIASTDTHASTPGATDEQNWGGHVSREATPEERLQPGLLTSGIEGNPGGLAGVWAVENSRDAIFDALERREVFGTSGPRIEPRLFAGWDFDPGLCERDDRLEVGYADGVPMGGDLAEPPDEQAPVFLAMATADTPASAPLAMLQIVKGWLDADGRKSYKVFTVAGDPDSDAGVDVTTGKRFGAGHDELCAVFRDPEFDPRQHAYYYLRAVENPSPRWSLIDCLRIEATKRPAVCHEDSDVPKVIREMAWSSPIWYRP